MSRRTEIALARWYPILANGVLLVLMLLQFARIEVRDIAGYLTGLSLYPAILLWIQSKDLHLCAWHRVLIANLMVFAFLQLLWMFGVKYNYFMYIAFISTIICIIVATFIAYRDGRFKKHVKTITQHNGRMGQGDGLRGVLQTDRHRAGAATKGCACLFSNLLKHLRK